MLKKIHDAVTWQIVHLKNWAVIDAIPVVFSLTLVIMLLTLLNILL
jgi:hypothetical protein